MCAHCRAQRNALTVWVSEDMAADGEVPKIDWDESIACERLEPSLPLECGPHSRICGERWIEVAEKPGAAEGDSH